MMCGDYSSHRQHIKLKLGLEKVVQYSLELHLHSYTKNA